MADSDSNAPATKADLIALEGRLKTDMTALEERLIETWRDMQTELLKAFYPIAEGITSASPTKNGTPLH